MVEQKNKKKVRLQDIAQLAGVSLSATSMALANHPDIGMQTKQKVNMLCKKMGYLRPGDRNQSASQEVFKKMPERFGLLVLRLYSQEHNPVYDDISNGLASATLNLGIRLEVITYNNTDLCDSKGLNENATKHLKDLDGLFIIGHVTINILAQIESIGVPYVTIGSILKQTEEDLPEKCIDITHDFQGMARKATSTLIDMGHKRIAFVTEIAPPGHSHTHWLEGYILAHYDHKIPLDHDLIQIAGKAYVGGEPAAEALFNLKDKPTGFISPDVRTAFLFLEAAKKRDIIIPREAIIMARSETYSQMFSLTEYPNIGVDLNDYYEICVQQLLQQFREPMPRAIKMTVPYKTYNFPKPK